MSRSSFVFRMKPDKFDRIAVSLCVLPETAFEYFKRIPRASTSANSDKHYNWVWSKPDLLLFPAGPGAQSAGENFPASETRPGPCSPDTFHRRRSFHRTLELISAEPNWKLEATALFLVFTNANEKRRTRLPIETCPPAFPWRGIRGREGEFVRKLVFALVKRNSIYFVRDFYGIFYYSHASEKWDANFDGNLWSHAPQGMTLN